MRRALLIITALVLCCLGTAGTYGTSPVTLNPGCQVLFASTDGTPITTGTFSQQFYLPTAGQGVVSAVSFELVWSGNPGAFNIQIQDADTDLTGNYVTLAVAGTITSSPQSAGGTYVSRVELNPWRAQYGRLYVNTQAANSVSLTAKVCR